ncbi:MAG: hypothetical protein ACRDKJ_14610 [Actinomycetota bacterium]
MDVGRLELYDLVVAMPSAPDQLVTKDYLDGSLARLESRLTWRIVTIMGACSVIVSSAWAAALAIIG